MHADEIEIDNRLVARLIESQFPQWANRPISRIPSTGTDNAIFRLGGDLAVRLPRIQHAAERIEKEWLWLPRLGPYLPLRVPVPLARGSPGEGYPWEWTVCRWLVGENAARARLSDLSQAANDLARFILALRSIDLAGGPPPGTHNAFRGVALAERDGETREAVHALDGMFDTRAVTRAWEQALGVPAWQSAPQWIHGDISAGNLLVVDGRLAGVIDFGCLGIGDPACDLMIGWTLFSGETRQAFRAAVAVDEATWERGRGWALSWALIYIPYYLKTNPVGVAEARQTIEQVLADRAV